jgi:class 3 adenylate cyclase/pimeloyl-ACP methyl ester carboxylesterase
MQQKVQFCTTSDGVQIAYSVIGSGYPLILVPGWVSHLELDMEPGAPGRPYHEALAQHFTLIRYDKRGTGLSDRNVSDFSLEPRLLDLEALVDKLKLDRYAIRGMSEGGPVAIAHAVRHPERVSHLVLLGTYAHLGASPTTDALIALVTAEWGLGSETLARIFVPSATQEEQKKFVRYQREGANRTDAAAMLAANVAEDVRDLLPQVQAPTLVIHSETDKAVPFEHARRLAGAIPDATLAQYKGDHAPLHAVDQIVPLIRDFILADVASAEPTQSAASHTDSGVRTVLFTDLVGHTEMMRRLGDDKGRAVLREHERITRELLREYAGAEVKTMGDGFMASFGSVTKAMDCAIALQRAFEQHSASTSEPLHIRVGLNAGEPIEEDGDLFGSTVILASRIAAKAGAGEILIPEPLRHLLAGKSYVYADRGEAVLKGFEDAVRLYEVRWQP